MDKMENENLKKAIEYLKNEETVSITKYGKDIFVIKEGWLLFIKKRWLKEIEKEVDKYNKVNEEQKIRSQIINELVKAYNKRFNDDLRKAGEKDV